MNNLREAAKNIQWRTLELEAHHIISGVIKDNKNHILLIQSNKYYDDGMWSIPTGKVERGERFIDALYREMKEEVNIVVTDRRYLTHDIEIFHRNNQNIPITQHVFDIIGYNGTIKNMESYHITDMKFMPLRDIFNLNRINGPTNVYLAYMNRYNKEYMSFPSMEHDRIKDALRTGNTQSTIRVCNQLNKYITNNKYITPWGDIIKVLSVDVYYNIKDIPTYDQLNPNELQDISNNKTCNNKKLEYITYKLIKQNPNN